MIEVKVKIVLFLEISGLVIGVIDRAVSSPGEIEYPGPGAFFSSG
jgi:hypothetical protein